VKTEKQIAKLHSVRYNKATDDVYIMFRVVDPKYKDFALQVGRRDDIELTIVGENLYLSEDTADAIV
jgi:hypothetical protein